jgi:hypothetical protein
MMLRELLGNSARHRYNTRKSGKVEIAFRREEEGAIFSLRDFGPDLPVNWKESLEMTLIRALAEQLSISLGFEEAEPGLRALLRFPLPALIPPALIERQRNDIRESRGEPGRMASELFGSGSVPGAKRVPRASAAWARIGRRG